MTKKQQMVHPATKFSFINLILALTLTLGGCSSAEQKQMNLARSEVEKGHFRIALSHLEKIMIRSPNSAIGVEAAREAARISFYEVKDFAKSVEFYRAIVINSPDAAERMKAQRQIVSIYFDHLNDYQKSVLEINKLIMMVDDPKERSEYKMRLARAYYYQNNFSQAENEVEEFLRSNPPADQKFDMFYLKGNIALAKKDLAAAAEIFRSVLAEFPDRAVKDNVGLTLSVCYEEMKNFKEAIDVLEKLKQSHPMPEYIDIRIKRMQERLKNQPGAKGRIRK